jgi:16S rRNA (adenine1518-N6/adenine1519-N6)-dimethyltransferase
MMQKETARRICAPIPSREAGAVTAAVRWRSEPELLFDVSRGSFYPPPDVDSSVIRLNLRKAPPFPVSDEKLLLSVIRGAFSQRRKTVLNSLSSALGLSKAVAADIFAAASVDPSKRAEALALPDFCSIANQLDKTTL